MATDIPGVNSDPACGTMDNENRKFAENLNGKLVVRTEDEAAIAVLNSILTELGGSAGVPFFAEGSATTTGAVQTLISVTVPVGKTRTLSKVIVSCNQSGRFSVKVNGSVVGSGRTVAGEPNAKFIWMPGRDVAAGDTITIEFTKSFGPNGSDVEAYLMATDL